MIHQLKRLCVPDCAYTESMFINFMKKEVSILSPLIADLSGLWGSSMQVMVMVAPRGYFQDDKEASGILKIMK